MGLILLIILLILLIGAIPAWPYSQGWGYNPLIILAIIFIIVLILVFTRTIVFWGEPSNSTSVTNKTEFFQSPNGDLTPKGNSFNRQSRP